MNTLAHSGIFWAGLIAGLVLIYFLPAMIGIIRKVESLGLLIFLNVLPTGVGWFAAMAMAKRSCQHGDRNGSRGRPRRAPAIL